jgi:hypothetical protein
MTTINTGRDGAGFESERNSFLRKKNQLRILKMN